MDKKRITIKDIAADVSVSNRTISLALNDKEGISKKIRNKVKFSAARLNYRPNIQARGPVQEKSYLFYVNEVTEAAQPKEDMGDRAYSMLEQFMEGRKPDSFTYTPELIIRNTTREIK